MPNEKKGLRIVQYCDNFYPVIDGVVKVVNNCALHLNEMEECKVVVPGYKKHPYDDSVFPYEVLRRPNLLITVNKYEVPLPRNKRSITKAIKNFKADIYHTHSPFFLGHYALKLARRYNVPLVATFHSKYKEDIMATTHSKLLTKFILGYIVRFLNRCDEVWVPSPRNIETLRSYGYKKDVFVMENGTDFVYPDDLEAVVRNAQNTFNIDPSHKNLLYVGQLRYVKNIKLILKTVKELVKEDSSYHIYLAGEGSDEKSIRNYVSKLQLDDNVHFVGKVADVPLLQGLYGACDLFFFPSTYDTFSIVVREASVMKVPSLLTIGSDAADPFIDWENGFLAQESVEAMKAKIVAIFADEEKMKLVGIRASETVPISFKTMAERADDRYRYLIEKHKKKHQKK